MRIPDRTTSKLYTESPAVRGVKQFAVNGKEERPVIDKGYAVVTREWQRGDRIEMQLPMEPQRVVADSRVKADADRVCLRYGPLMYNVETADNEKIDHKLSDAPLHVEWRPDLLGGVTLISLSTPGQKDAVTLIPYYAWCHRGPGEMRVWFPTTPAANSSARTEATPAFAISALLQETVEQ